MQSLISGAKCCAGSRAEVARTIGDGFEFFDRVFME